MIRVFTMICLMASVAWVFPGGTASGTVNTPVLVAMIENQYDHSCAQPVADSCFFDIHHEDELGNATVDLYQRIEYVGIAIDFSILRSQLGEYWLLPDAGLAKNGSDFYVPNPAFAIVTENWSAVPQPSEDYQVRFTPRGFGLFYYGPPAGNAAFGNWSDRNLTVAYSDESGGVGSSRIGPFNQLYRISSDTLFVNHSAAACTAVPVPDCKAIVKEKGHTLNSKLPNVTYGLEFYSLEFATDPSNLTTASSRFLSVNESSSSVKRLEADRMQEDAPPTRGWTLDARGTPPDGHPADPSDEPPRRSAPLRLHSQKPGFIPPDRTFEIMMGIAAATGAILALLGAALYSRFHNKTEALGSETRNRILALIRENPGICLSDAAERMGVARNTIRHHLRVLERVGLVRVADEANLKTYYPAGAQPLQVPAWLRRNETCLAILHTVAQSEAGLGRNEVRALLPEVPDRTRNYHLKRLLSVGALVQVEDESGAQRFRVGTQWSGQGSSSGTTA